jgi:bifunctional non-homologous end joining protein LigD
VQFYAFDILAGGGEDLRKPLSMRRINLPGCWRGASTASTLPISSRARSGPDQFRHACLMGLEGMVSKHRGSTYRGQPV